MNKGFKIFFSIVYYLLTFAIGFMLALALPSYYEEVIKMDMITESLNNKRYDEAMELVGGYFNKTPIYQQDFGNGSGIVLFEAVTLVYNSGEEDDKTIDGGKLHKSYAGFLYNAKDYDCVADEDNQTHITVTNSLNQMINYNLKFDFDSNGDKKNTNDSISTLVKKNLLYLDFDQETFNSISKIVFYDKSGNTYVNVINLNLNYNEAFFTDVNDFVVEYNKDFTSDKLSDLDQEFKAKNSNYATSSSRDASTKANQKAIWGVVIYFIIVYIVADFLVGKHYIIRFFKWLLQKVFKVDFGKKSNNKNNQDVQFGHDYYCQLKISLDVTDVPEFSDGVNIHYSNENETIEFLLSKQSFYATTKRVKAGIYMNPWIDINGDYESVNLPENLKVEGFSMNVVVKIKKIERK